MKSLLTLLACLLSLHTHLAQLLDGDDFARGDACVVAKRGGSERYVAWPHAEREVRCVAKRGGSERYVAWPHAEGGKSTLRDGQIKRARCKSVSHACKKSALVSK